MRRRTQCGSAGGPGLGDRRPRQLPADAGGRAGAPRRDGCRRGRRRGLRGRRGTAPGARRHGPDSAARRELRLRDRARHLEPGALGNGVSPGTPRSRPDRRSGRRAVRLHLFAQHLPAGDRTGRRRAVRLHPVLGPAAMFSHCGTTSRGTGAGRIRAGAGGAAHRVQPCLREDPGPSPERRGRRSSTKPPSDSAVERDQKSAETSTAAIASGQTQRSSQTHEAARERRRLRELLIDDRAAEGASPRAR